jgi:hypothetical protein
MTVHTWCDGRYMITRVRFIHDGREYINESAEPLRAIERFGGARDPLASAHFMWVFNLTGVTQNLRRSDPGVSHEIQRLLAASVAASETP